MKKIFNLMLVAMVMLVAACENDAMDSVKGEGESLSFYAEIAGDTKAYIDDADGDKTWNTIWEKDDILQVSTNGTVFYDFKYDGEKFTCTKDGVNSLIGETVTINSTSNARNSYAGKQGWGINGTQVENFSANSTITLEASTSYFRYTYNGDSDITFTVKVDGENPPYVFQDGLNFFEEITIPCKEGVTEYFVPFWTQKINSVNATISYTIDGVVCKEKATTLAPGKVYNLGTLEAPLAGTGEGTAESPYDVVRAKAAIDAYTTVSDAYVKGIVTETATKYYSNYKSCDYYISVDGNTDNELMVYSGKFVDGADFNSADQIHAGDEVVVCGDLKLYNGTYEFNYSSKIVSLVCNHETTEEPNEPASTISLPWIETFDGDLSAYTMTSNEKGDNYIDASSNSAQLSTAPELMFRYGTSFAATIASDGTAKTLYLTFNANYTDRVSATSTTEGVTIEKNGNLSKLASYIVNVPAGLDSFEITLNNIHTSSNVRIDNIRLAETEYERGLTAISVAGATDTFIIGSTYEFDGEVIATYDSYETVAVENYIVDSSAVNIEVAGTYEVIVSYTEGGVTKTASYNVTVKESSAVTTTEVEILASDFNSSSYANNNGEHTKEGVAYHSYQVMLSSNVMQWQKNKGYIYNTASLGKIESISINNITGGSFTVYAGNTANPTTTKITGTNGTYDLSGGDYSFFTIKVGSTTGKCQSITITYTK